MKNATLRGKPDAGNPHVAPTPSYGGTGRFDEGEVASAKPRCGSLLYKTCLWTIVLGMQVAGAAAPAAPVVRYCDYINGKIGVITTWTSGTTLEYEVRAKGSTSEADWTALGSCVSPGGPDFWWNNYNGTTWTCTTNFTGTLELRVRHLSGGEYSSWTLAGDVTATVNAGGTTIGLAQNASVLNNAFDGSLITMIDATGDTSSKAWVGKKFAHPTRIAAIRYLPRLDVCRNRYQNSIFEIASDETFADAVTVHTCPASITEAMLGRVQVVTFETPVTCGAIRHNKGQLESTLELEFIPADPPWEPTPASGGVSDVTNLHPVVTWIVPSALGSTQSRLLRSLHASGPFAPVSGWFASGTTPVVTNTDQYVGVPYHYVVEADAHAALFPDTTVVTTYTPLAVTRLRRIDRAWSDETTLLAGCSVLPLTNGTVSAGSTYTLDKAFDGNPATFADIWQGAGKPGPVGLRFTSPVWVGAFGYICRHDNTCYYRVKNSALFSADGDDVALGGRVRRSANCARSSQDATLYYQETTSIPTLGARCWFLFNDSANPDSAQFYCDVAEVLLFGWTEADLAAAPVVTAPASLTFSHGAGLDVAWSVGYNAATYTVERRLRGADAWTTVATGLTARTLHEDGLATGYYEYRVTAVGEYGTATSEVAGYPYYVAGDGTGLRGAVWAPYVSTNGVLAQGVQVIDRGVEAVALDLATAPAEGLAETARLVWTGTITCPFAGDYTFTLTTAGGGAVWIDGADVCNAWSGTGRTPSGTVTLTAGDHTIRVDARLADGVPNRTLCRLAWGGVVPDETVPASQLKPSAAPASPVHGAWREAAFGVSTLGLIGEVTGGYRIVGSTRDLNTSNTRRANELMYLGQEIRGDFDFSAFLWMRNGQHGHGYLMVRNAEGDFLSAYVHTAGQVWTKVGVRHLLSGQTVFTQMNDTTASADGSYYRGWLRITRSGNVFSFYQKLAESDDWTLLSTYTDVDNAFRGTYSVGFATSADPGQTAMKGTYDITNINLKLLRGLQIILR